VHDPAVMPFLTPWTDAPPAERARSTLQWNWRRLADLTPQHWALALLVRVDGRVVGVQELVGVGFAVTREVETGSWLGRRHQGRGVGTAMRAAALAFAFDHLGAVRARSAAFADNAASLRVSEKLGYRPNGTARHVRRGEPATEVLLRLTPDEFVRPGWALQVEGLDGCRGLLGA
jgi:RimJ/RimL family protein N-acetyltransferase